MLHAPGYLAIDHSLLEIVVGFGGSLHANCVGAGDITNIGHICKTKLDIRHVPYETDLMITNSLPSWAAS